MENLTGDGEVDSGKENKGGVGVELVVGTAGEGVTVVGVRFQSILKSRFLLHRKSNFVVWAYFPLKN